MLVASRLPGNPECPPPWLQQDLQLGILAGLGAEVVVAKDVQADEADAETGKGKSQDQRKPGQSSFL